jgi:hypothetical protein
MLNISPVSGIIYADISDHLPCFLSFPVNSVCVKPDRPLIRIFSDRNKEVFREKMSNFEWHTIYECNEDPYRMFVNIVKGFLESSFPLVQLSRKRSHDKPWISSALKVSIKHNYRLYRKSLKSLSDLHKAAYNRYNKTLKKCINKAREMYYKKIFGDKKNAAINLWKKLGPIINNPKCKRHDITKLLNNDEMITDKKEIANAMNGFFCNIGRKLQQKFIGNNPTEFQKYLDNPPMNSFYLRPFNEQEVLFEIKKIDPKKASGIDNIGGKILNICPEIFALNLCKLFNIYIEEGIYPDDMKIARVVALHKKGHKYLPNNYRPISLLPCFNKIFEKLLCKNLLRYLESYELLYEFQYGFRKLFSTALALIETTDGIRKLLDQGEYVLGIYVDLTKAFDTVDHDILLLKLNHYGIRGHANKFFKSYLNNRKQCTFVNGVTSDFSIIDCGVPQGSVLGPVLFLIYINDLYCALNDAMVRLFADDTCVFIHDTNFDYMISQAKQALQSLVLWCKYNKLTISSEKTCFMIFHTKNKDKHPEVTDIEVNGLKISRVQHVKYLGVVIDDKLCWDNHINSVCKNLLRYFGIFNHIKTTTTQGTARQIYFAFIYSRISYGIEVTGSCSNRLLSKLQVIQNKLLKLLLRLDRMTATNHMHSKLHLLKVEDIFKMKTLLFVNKCLTGNCPPHFAQYFSWREHNYNIRNKLLVSHRSRTTCGSLCVSRLGAQMWNNLDRELKAKHTQKNFKKIYVKSCLRKY